MILHQAELFGQPFHDTSQLLGVRRVSSTYAGYKSVA